MDFRLWWAMYAGFAIRAIAPVGGFCNVPYPLWMPSPIGHALGGIAAGCALGGRQVRPSHVVAFAIAGVAPDLDLLVGAHSGPTHSIGAALLVGIVALAIWKAPRMAIAIAAAYASHILLDWLGSDTSPPIGIMALWPFTREHYESSLHVFMAISRRYWLPEFWTYNVRALAREIVILLPLALLSGVRSCFVPDPRAQSKT